MSILVTGAAGFIGYHSCATLLRTGHQVIGIDNLNDYYDPHLKAARLDQLTPHASFLFYPADISDQADMQGVIESHQDITHIIHLAAQPGVRYSVENPFAYVTSNLVGHMVMLESCRNLPNLKHFVYASSSSVYGGNTKLPFSIEDRVDTPHSLYAATKRSDELLTHSYAHMFGIAATGLRFFTVYGPWARPDMATFLFTKAIIDDKPITVFNDGKMQRDFTYIDDIVSGIIASLNILPQATPQHQVLNLGNHKSEPLPRFIEVLEQAIGKKAIIEYAPMHKGDVEATYADIRESETLLNFKPLTSIEEGLPKFVEWYKEYYSLN